MLYNHGYPTAIVSNPIMLSCFVFIIFSVSFGFNKLCSLNLAKFFISNNLFTSSQNNLNLFLYYYQNHNLYQWEV